eukprot:GEMP01006908.1.p1 GENE.GEMP01006908.1~~GEMP01006908.1.p1  ORF type:complete len:1003 (+),score=283.75 GEMP01006908.1:49-3057(+)
MMQSKEHLQNAGRAALGSQQPRRSPSPMLCSNPALSRPSSSTAQPRSKPPIPSLRRAKTALEGASMESATSSSASGSARRVPSSNAGARLRREPDAARASASSRESHSAVRAGGNGGSAINPSISNSGASARAIGSRISTRGSTEDTKTGAAPSGKQRAMDGTTSGLRVPSSGATAQQRREQAAAAEQAATINAVLRQNTQKISQPDSNLPPKGAAQHGMKTNTLRSAPSSLKKDASQKTSLRSFTDAAPRVLPTRTAPQAPQASRARGTAGKPVTATSSLTPAVDETDVFDEDDVVYSWPPKPPPVSAAAPSATSSTREPSALPSPRNSEIIEDLTSRLPLPPTISRALFEPPAIPQTPSSAKISVPSGVDNLTISKALAERRARKTLQLPFHVVQVMKDRPLFEQSCVGAAAQRMVRAWVRGECSGEMIALSMLQRPAFFVEDKVAQEAIEMLATTPMALCGQMSTASSILASELEVKFLKQECDLGACSGLWREVVRQTLGCPITGYDHDTLRAELSESPPAATRERNGFIGRYIYDLLQIKRELLKGSADTAYDVLGVKPTATDKQVRTAYRMLCLKHHPDKGGDPAQFLAIQRAYHTIMEMRKEERGEADDMPATHDDNDEEEDDTAHDASNDQPPNHQSQHKNEGTPSTSTSDGGEHNGELRATEPPHWLCAKLAACLEEVRVVRDAGRKSVMAKQTIESLRDTYTLHAVQDATEAAKSAIADALVVVAEGLGDRVAKLVLNVGQSCMDIPENDAAAALVVEQGMRMLIKGQSLQDASKALKPVQKDISLALETLKANLTISNMLGSMDAETAKMSLGLVVEAGRRAQSALRSVLEISEALELTISTAILHAQSLSSAPSVRVASPAFEPMEPPPSSRQPKPPEDPKPAATDNGTSKVESVAADQRQLFRRLLEDIEMIRRPLSKNGLVLAIRILCESLASNIPLSVKDPFSVPNAALKAVLHHPEGHGRLSILLDEAKRLSIPISDELMSLISPV